MRETSQNSNTATWFETTAAEIADEILRLLDARPGQEHGPLPRRLLTALHRRAIEMVDDRLAELEAVHPGREAAQAYGVTRQSQGDRAGVPKTSGSTSGRVPGGKKRGPKPKTAETGTNTDDTGGRQLMASETDPGTMQFPVEQGSIAGFLGAE